LEEDKVYTFFNCFVLFDFQFFWDTWVCWAISLTRWHNKLNICYWGSITKSLYFSIMTGGKKAKSWIGSRGAFNRVSYMNLKILNV
jgi:hypothetical protein